jgi:hypothetical protein
MGLGPDCAAGMTKSGLEEAAPPWALFTDQCQSSQVHHRLPAVNFHQFNLVSRRPLSAARRATGEYSRSGEHCGPPSKPKTDQGKSPFRIPQPWVKCLGMARARLGGTV